MSNKDLVHIIWEDAHSIDEWSDKHEDSPCLCETIGLIVKETDSLIAISHTKQIDDDTYCCTILIPKSCIKKITYLKAIEDGSRKV